MNLITAYHAGPLCRSLSAELYPTDFPANKTRSVLLFVLDRCYMITSLCPPVPVLRWKVRSPVSAQFTVVLPGPAQPGPAQPSRILIPGVSEYQGIDIFRDETRGGICGLKG